MRDIVNLCREEQICLMADEVYQENIWKEGAKFTSFRKVAFDMNAFEGT
jgi:aspartate/methionine/tyrosine aminotransferase